LLQDRHLAIMIFVFVSFSLKLMYYCVTTCNVGKNADSNHLTNACARPFFKGQNQEFNKNKLLAPQSATS